MNVVDTIKNAAFASAIQAALNYMDKDPETNIPKVMSIVDKAAPEGWYESQRNAIRQGIAEKGNWYQLAQKGWELDPGVRITFFTNFIVNASLKGSALLQLLPCSSASEAYLPQTASALFYSSHNLPELHHSHSSQNSDKYLAAIHLRS